MFKKEINDREGRLNKKYKGGCFMKATKNLRKSIISGLLTLVMAAAMFVCMGKVEVQAATKSAKNVKEGDLLKPGDVLTYNGTISLCELIYGYGFYDEFSEGMIVDVETGLNSLVVLGDFGDGFGDVYCLKVVAVTKENNKINIQIDKIYSESDLNNYIAPTPAVPETPATPPVATGPKQLEDATLFDATYYAATYPDVAAVLGTDETALYNHYVSYGKAEGRFPNAASVPVVAGPKQMADGTLFDAAYYAATYPDVAAVFGTDEAMLYNHYVLCGKAEGRLPYEGAKVPVNPLAGATVVYSYESMGDLISEYSNGMWTSKVVKANSIWEPEYWIL